jgi:hypothetical protein
MKLMRFFAPLLIVSLGFGAGTPLVPGSRIQALSGTFIGLADDANAMYYNPAGIFYQVTMSTDVSFWRTDDGGLGGASAMFVNPSNPSGAMVGIGWTGIGLTGSTSEERAGAFIVPTVFSPMKRLPLGLGIKVVYGRNQTGDLKWRVTGDGGTLMPIIPSLKVGVVIRNILTTDLTSFPSTLGIGGAWSPISTLHTLIDMEGSSIQQIKDGGGTVALGIEFLPIRVLTLRGGMRKTSDNTLISGGVELKQYAQGSGLGIAYWFPSDEPQHGWFSIGFTYQTR